MTDGISADPTAAPATPVSTPADTTTTEAPATPPVEESTGTLMTDALKDAANPETDKQDDTAKPETAPEAYADFTLPEGMTPDTELMGKFAETAKSMNLSQENAQKLVDVYQEAATKAAQESAKAWSDVQTQWTDQIKADPEVGGAKTKDIQINIAKAINELVPDQKQQQSLLQALSITGAGNNPEILRFVARMANRFTESSKVVSGVPPIAKQTGRVADKLYNNNPT